MKIAFLGGGNMARALIGGLLAQGFDTDAISVIEVDASAREKLAALHGVRLDDDQCTFQGNSPSGKGQDQTR